MEKYLIILFLIISFGANAKKSRGRWSFFEVGGSFSYHRQVYGEKRDSKSISRTYSGSLAMYILRYSALEVNYSHNEDNIIDSRPTVIDETNNISIIQTHQRVYTQVYGAGLRQRLAPLSWRIAPYLSLGYAKQVEKTILSYTVDFDGTTKVLKYVSPPRQIDSVFGTFTLAVEITQFFKLTGSVATVFKAFESNRAKDNLKYLPGLRWIF